ncbi:hypothetical protein C8Q80DRAFT_1146525 [Daedaleopsis nitida]|nr:hypothetical protein C8Q80DRAFT_1146525 [Daedaleopsis nitida]
MCSLTFDLLEALIGTTIPRNDLLARGHMNRLIIAGDSIARLVVPWARAICASDCAAKDPSHRERGERVQRTLVRTISALDDAVYASEGCLDHCGPFADLVCALATFLVSLSRWAQAVWGGRAEAGDFRFLEDHTRMYGEVVHILRARLHASWRNRAAGEMERLLEGGIPFAAYATACRPTISNVYTVDTKDYVAKHVEDGCSCALVKPSVDDVRECLERGDVPVVTFDGRELVVHGASRTPYVAISHVWADGLGSTTEDGLPRCQVQRLANFTRALVPGGAFWQDGLCVPSVKALRRRAIALMVDTYANADKVVVIDHSIRTQCTLSTPKEECLLRIATSGWMQRIWTLQEGMLGRELVFEVADGLIDCTHFDGYPYVTAIHLMPILRHRRRDDSTLAFERRLAHPPRCTLNDLITLLRYRTTSHPEDEPVAIAGLLGVDAGKLVCLEGRQKRMRALFLHLREVPRHLALFGWSCDRLALPHFSWAPASLSDMLWPGDDNDPLIGTCTDDGLFGDFAVVRFPQVQLADDCGVIATISDSSHGRNEGCASRVFNLVLSPHAFGITPWSQRGTLTFDGFLMKRPSLANSLHEEGVGVVRILGVDDTGLGDSLANVLRCHFVAAGSARWGLPETAKTTRARGHWHFVNATAIKQLRRVRVV